MVIPEKIVIFTLRDFSVGTRRTGFGLDHKYESKKTRPKIQLKLNMRFS